MTIVYLLSKQSGAEQLLRVSTGWNALNGMRNRIRTGGIRTGVIRTRTRGTRSRPNSVRTNLENRELESFGCSPAGSWWTIMGKQIPLWIISPRIRSREILAQGTVHY